MHLPYEAFGLGHLKMNLHIFLKSLHTRTFLTSKIPIVCDPILVHVPLLNEQPHYSQYGGENATPPSHTPLLAYYYEIQFVVSWVIP